MNHIVQPKRTDSALAISGGAPVRTNPLPAWPQFGEDEIEAATAVLRSGRVNYWTGKECQSFEREFASHIGVDHAIALANGTVALELALAALGIGAGDEVVVPARTYFATASCAVVRGATPVIADVDADSQVVTAATIASVLTSRTRAIIVVHLAGWPCDMVPIMTLARQQGLYVIEDCAQSHGAALLGRMAGSFGHFGAFSFCQDKIMTTGGEGGMLVTDDKDLWERAWSYKDHGKNRPATETEGAVGAFKWLHHQFGTNWRMTEFQAAIGRIQLGRLPGWSSARRQHATRLATGLAAIRGLRIPFPPPEVEHAFYKFYAFLRPECLRAGWDQQRVIEAIHAEGIPCGVGSCSEIYREKAFLDAGLGPKAPLPVAHSLGQTSLMFMVHPTLTGQDIDDTCEAIRKVMAAASA